MQATTYIADRILSKHDIVEYLESRGLRAESGIKGRKLFCCPLHNEDTPSFIVYPPSERDPYQSYMCYGCKRGGNLITLRSELEGRSRKDVVNELASGMGIKVDDQIRYAIEQIEKKYDASEVEELEDCMLLISRAVFNHLEVVDRDPREFNGCENILRMVDEAADRCNTARVVEIWHALPEFLYQKAQAHHAAKDNEYLDAVRAYSKV